MLQIRMLMMNLKVLLSACMLMFSASVGLSAVYDCKFDKGKTRTSGPQSGLSGPADGRMLIDTETATVYISENNWVGNINGSHNIKIDNGGSLFTWSWNWSSFYWYKIQLENTNSLTNAYLDVTRAVGMIRYKNKTKCKLLRSDFVATIETPSTEGTTILTKPDALEAIFLEQGSYDRRNLQLALSDLGLYRFKIDGFYGSGTERALKAYNDEYFRGSDLTKADNVSALFEDILSQRVLEVKEPASLDNLIEQIDDIVGGELEPGEVELSE